MNKLFKVFTMAVMLVMASHAMAQSHGTMFLGASFPIGDFGDGDEFMETALGGYDDDGGAGIGFNAGLRWDFGVGVPGLGVLLSVDGLYNGPNADLNDDYKHIKRDLEAMYENSRLSSPKYINVPAMLGLRYCFYLNPQFGIYAEGGAGCNMRFITDYSQKGSTKLLKRKNITVFDYENAFSFAWQLGLGIEVSKKLVVGCSFYDLGKADVKGELLSVVEGVNMPTVDFEYGTLHPMMILARVGFRF